MDPTRKKYFIVGGVVVVVVLVLTLALLATIAIVLSTTLTVGVDDDSDSNDNNNNVGTITHYSATASVGDFLEITIDSAARTLWYSNYKSNLTGTFNYTVNADGTLDILGSDDLERAVVLPGYGLLLHINKGGPNANTRSLVTGLPQSRISLAGVSGRSFNYHQFRTSSGGMEMGHFSIASDGALSTNMWWPFGECHNDSFRESGGSLGGAVEGPDQRYIYVPAADAYVFGNNGFLAIDLDAGSWVAMPEADSTEFDVNNSPGVYTALIYHKTNATTQAGNHELGNVILDKARVSVLRNSSITITSMATSQVLFDGTLAPISDDPTVVGPGKLTSPCPGVFLARKGSAILVVSFHSDTIYFSSYTPAATCNNDPYAYFNGAGIRLP